MSYIADLEHSSCFDYVGGIGRGGSGGTCNPLLNQWYS